MNIWHLEFDADCEAAKRHTTPCERAQITAAQQNVYLGVTGAISVALYLCVLVAFFRKPIMRGVIGATLLMWSTVSAMLDMSAVLRWAVPSLRFCFAHALSQFFSLYGSSIYFFTICVLLFRSSRNPFCEPGWKAHAIVVFFSFVLALSTYYFDSFSCRWRENEWDGTSCKNVALLTWQPLEFGRVMFVCGGLTMFYAYRYLKVAFREVNCLTSESWLSLDCLYAKEDDRNPSMYHQASIFTERKKLVLKTLLWILVIYAAVELSIPTIVVLLESKEKDAWSCALECCMQGLSTGVPAAVWLFVYCYYSEVMEKADPGTISDGLRGQIMKLITASISADVKQDRELSDKEKNSGKAYTAREKLNLGKGFGTIDLTVLAPSVFADIRKVFKIDSEAYIKSVEPDGREQFTEGKSGAFLYFTHDRRYIIKTATDEDMRVLASILQDYHEHVRKYPDTLINPMVGAYHMKLHTQVVRVIVIASCFPPGLELIERFDLKGSWVGRARGPKPKGPAKDNDIDKPFLLKPDVSRRLSHQLRFDALFLARVNIMDYSLLVGVGKASSTSEVNLASPEASDGSVKYAFGIIDILQGFTFRKRFEHFMLTVVMRKGPGVSCVPPTDYAERFNRHVVDKLIKGDLKKATYGIGAAQPLLS